MGVYPTLRAQGRVSGRRALLVLSVFAVTVVTAPAASAAVVTYEGLDAGAGPTSARPNADAARSSFVTGAGALGAVNVLNFEALTPGGFTTATVATGVTATLTGHVESESGIRNEFGNAIEGYNTTAGGSKYLRLIPIFGVGTAKIQFSFTDPIQAFGTYITGLGTASGNLVVTFTDDTVQELAVPGAATGGAKFFGFTDAGKAISAVSLELRNVTATSRDIFSVDDVQWVESGPPTVTYTLDPVSPNGLNGWYTTPVGLDWTVAGTADTLSGCDDALVSDDGNHARTCSATNGAGTGNATATFKIDATPPTSEVSGVTAPTYLQGQEPTLSCDASDATSGVATDGTPSTPTAGVGPKSVTCNGATDNAGNVQTVASAPATYSIAYDFDGFFSPIDMAALNAAKAGSAIPVKFSLGGDQGMAIMAAGSPSSQGITCDTNATVDAIETTVSAGSSSLQYDPVTDRYTYVWKTNKAWSGCRRLTVELADGQTYTADFRFRK